MNEVKKGENRPSSLASCLPQLARSGTVLAFDFGEKRIGVAVGDFETGLAHSLTTLRVEDNRSRFAAIAALIEEWRPTCLVVGLPAHADGTEHRLSSLCRRFARRLEGRFGIRTHLADERFTSQAAQSALRDAGIHGTRLKAAIDQAAAREILVRYFASARRVTAS